MMHEYPVTAGVLALAKKKANMIPPNLRDSIRSGEGREVGSIGEVIFCKVMGGVPVSPDNPYNYDVKVGNRTYDVKSKECTSPPRMDYFASVAAANIRQECDCYCFMRVLKPKGGTYERAWVMGFLSKKEFFEKAIFYREGELDPSSTFGWRFKADCYNIKYSDLNQFSKKV